MFSGKKILIGVTGSIAAYKSAELIRLLHKSGAFVQVVMTPSAKEFITPLTLSVLSKNPALSDFTSLEKTMWNNHVELGLWADMFIIAPTTANTLSKMANGICDNLLMTVYLSACCPVYAAPAMDVDMYKHPSTQKNLSALLSFGVKIIYPATGELASGLTGEGRMESPENILLFLEKENAEKLPLKKKKALVTAGPTYEAIDPVRFIGNHSSGKMGFAVAEELARKGADVTLITGPVFLSEPHPRITIKKVTSADEMFNACNTVFPSCDITVMAAAVADFKPIKTEKLKIKKNQNISSVELVPTIDILATLGSKKRKKQLLVGFALETDNEMTNAKQKLKKKNLDFVVLNSLQDKGAGFQHDTNRISILDKHGKIETYTLKLKQEAAEDIVSKIITMLPE